MVEIYQIPAFVELMRSRFFEAYSHDMTTGEILVWDLEDPELIGALTDESLELMFNDVKGDVDIGDDYDAFRDALIDYVMCTASHWHGEAPKGVYPAGSLIKAYSPPVRTLH